MSTVPAMPPVQPESMTSSPPLASLAPTIPDEMLYEVVDGRIVEKKMSAGDRDCFILVGLLTPLRTNRLGKARRGNVFPDRRQKDLRRRPDVAFVSHATLALQSSHSQSNRSGTWSPSSRSRSSARPTPPTKSWRRSTSTWMPACSRLGRLSRAGRGVSLRLADPDPGSKTRAGARWR